MTAFRHFLTITILLFLIGCGSTKKVTCGDGREYIIPKKVDKPILNSINVNVSQLTKALNNIDSSRLTLHASKLIDTLSLFLNHYKDSAVSRINSNFMMYMASPCNVNFRDRYFENIQQISYRIENFNKLEDKIDSSQGLFFQNFKNVDELFTALLRVTPPLIENFPTDYREFELRNVSILEKSLVETLNKYHFTYETITKDGISFTKTGFVDLKIPNYRNRGLIALLISRVYQTGSFFKYRIQFIIKKQYSSIDELQEPDKQIEDYAEVFLDNLSKELTK